MTKFCISLLLGAFLLNALVTTITAKPVTERPPLPDVRTASAQATLPLTIED